MNIFDAIVAWFGDTSLYIKYISQWPAPLNSVSFDAVVLIVLAFFAVRAVQDKLHEREFKRRAEEERFRAEEERRAKKEEREQWEQYTQFMMVASVSHMSSLMGLSFEEWRSMKDKAKSGELLPAKREAEPEPVKAKEPAPSLDSIVDSLTGLYNRRGFELHFASAQQDGFGVVYLDANNLKATNDTMGHKYGDKLLIAIANALRTLFPDQAHRLGGDEFVVMLDGVGPAVIEKKIEEFGKRLQHETDSDPDGLIYSSAVGFCVNDGTMSKQEVVDAAEKAMYENKRAMKAAPVVAEEPEEEIVVEENVEEIVEEPVVIEAVPEVVEEEPVIEQEEEVNEEPAEEPVEDFSDFVSHLTDLVEEEPEPVEIPVIEQVEDEPEPEIKAPIDLSQLLAEKAPENVSEEDMANDFLSVLNAIEADKTEKEHIKAVNEQVEAIKESNLKALDHKVQSGLSVEGVTERVVDTGDSEELDADFEKRRAQALKAEEKEAAKQAKLKEKEEKAIAKQEAKEARRNKKGKKHEED